MHARVGAGLALSLSIAAACGDAGERPGFEPAEVVDAGGPEASNELPPTPPGNALCEGAAARANAAGCHFMQIVPGITAPVPPPRERLDPGCYALVVTNPNDVPVHLKLRRNGEEVDGAPYARLVEVDGRSATYAPLPSGAIPARATAVLSAVHASGGAGQGPPNFTWDCPSLALVEETFYTAQGNAVVGQRGHAIELLTDGPVLVMSVSQYQKDGGTEPIPIDGPWGPVWPPFVLHPVHLWRAGVLDTGAFEAGRPAKLENPAIPMGDDGHLEYELALGRTSVVAAEDGTVVTWPERDGGTSAVTLERGGIETRPNEDDLIGRTFFATKPIGVLHTLDLPLPWDFPFGDELDVENIASAVPPETVWGSEYVAVRHADRWPDVTESPPWRIVGGADGTTLTYEPSKPAGAPDHVERGQLAIFEAGEPFVVRSQDDAHRFFFGGHMTGGRYVLQRNGRYPNDVTRGGPVSKAEVPTRRWAKRYPFFALMNWTEQYLVVVRRQGGKDVVLDCAGTIGGFRPAGRFEYAYVQLVDRELNPVPYGGSRCQAGAHWIESEEPFHATLWGVTTAERTRLDSIGTSSAYAIPLVGDDGVPRAGTQ